MVNEIMLAMGVGLIVTGYFKYYRPLLIAQDEIVNALNDRRYNRRSCESLRRVTGKTTLEILTIVQNMPYVETLRDDETGELWFRFGPK